MALIESGTLTPGVDVSAWRLPDHTALRWELPAPALRPFVLDYHVLDSDGPWELGERTAWMLPSWPAIRVQLAARRMQLQIGSRRYAPVHLASLYGTTTRAMEARAYGGVTIGFSIAPLGWSRLLRGRADQLRDRIVPLAEAMPPAVVEELIARLRVIGDMRQVKPVLDAFLADQVGPPTVDEAKIAALTALIEDDAVDDLAAAAAVAGIRGDALRRLATRYFGFPPKTLLMRARFLRTFMPMLLAGRPDYTAAVGRYHDVPHFLRDARRFLTMTPRQFMAIDQPYLHAAMRALASVVAADRRAPGDAG